MDIDGCGISVILHTAATSWAFTGMVVISEVALIRRWPGGKG